jgi:hypothetical protein
MITRSLLFGLVAAGALAITLSPAASADTTAVQPAQSANWAGYTVGTGASTGSAQQFTHVSGSWVVPSANCAAGQGDAAVWIGLGGASQQSQALEQTGTEVDCGSGGQPAYFAWYELVPAAPVHLALAIHPGDHIFSSVAVTGNQVTVAVSDQTTSASTTKTLPMDSPDVSSAEWIAEAPSACDGSGTCQTLPLADFGNVTFTDASATANGHTGPISDPQWATQPMQLTGSADGFTSDQPAAGARPSSLSTTGSSFSVAWQGNGGQASQAGSTTDSGSAGTGGAYPGAPGAGSGGYPGLGDQGSGDGSGGAYGGGGGGAYGYGGGGGGGAYGYGGAGYGYGGVGAGPYGGY